MQLLNSSTRRPKTYGKKTGKSYWDSGFEKFSSQDIWSDDCANLRDDLLSGVPTSPEVRSRRHSTNLTRKILDETAEAGQEEPVTKYGSLEGKQSLDVALQHLSITTKDVNRRSTSQPRSPLSPKVVNTQLSPAKRILKVGIENASIGPKDEDQDSTIPTRLIKEHGQDGCREATRVSKDTPKTDPQKEICPRNLRRGKARSKDLNELGNDEGLTRLQPLLRLSHDEKDRHVPGDFHQWASELTALFTIEKIAEASYGEVYRVNGTDRTNESVLKVIPLKPLVKTRSKRLDMFQMSSIEDVLTEARTLTRMTVIPGFTNLRDIRMMRGQLPKEFVQAWKRYLRNGAKSYFPDPSKRGSYSKDQLWAIIEMENAGVDLEKFELRDMIQIWDIFWGVAMALAKGEELAGFEVRCIIFSLHGRS